MQVKFIDFGNDAVVTENEVTMLTDEMKQYPVYGLRCYLSGIVGLAPGKAWDPEVVTKNGTTLWNMKVNEVKADRLGVTLINTNGSELNEDLVERGVAIGTVKKARAVEEIVTMKDLESVIVQEGQSYEVLVTAASNFDDFTAQLASKVKGLSRLTEALDQIQPTACYRYVIVQRNS